MATSDEPQLSARLSQLHQRALDALSTDASAQSVQKLTDGLHLLAAELMLEWLTGEKRFESQSQQTEYWLARFYDEMYPDEQPDATHIYSRFGLTLPRAGYFARLLRARATATWRSAARLELAKRLGEKKASALQEKADGQSSITDYDIGLSPGAADELRVQYDRLIASLAEGVQPRPPKVKPAFGGLRWLSVPADTLLLMLDRLEQPERGAK
jgi:hypothetical protein